MTIEHAGPFLESAIFDGSRANVMFVLCNYADDYGECWPSYEAIATSARCARETAMREVKWLAETGCLEILRGDDRPTEKQRVAGRCNVFRVNLDLIRAMYSIVRAIKETAGREPKKRYDAVRRVARWAEETIAAEGAQTVIRAAGEIIAKGDVGSLFRIGNSDPTSPSPPTKGDVGSPSRVTWDHPNLHKNLHRDPSARAREAASEPEGSPPRGERAATAKADRGEDQPPGGGSEAKKLLDQQVEAIACWVADGAINDPYPRFWLAFPDLRMGHALGHAGSWSRIEAMPRQALAKAASWIEWAEDVIACRPDVKPPEISGVRRIVSALTADLPILRQQAAERGGRVKALALERRRAAQPPPERDDHEAEQSETTA